MAGLVAGHLVDGVVDGVEAVLLRAQARSNLPLVAPNSQSTRHLRLSFVLAFMLGSRSEPSISANFYARTADKQ